MLVAQRFGRRVSTQHPRLRGSSMGRAERSAAYIWPTWLSCFCAHAAKTCPGNGVEISVCRRPMASCSMVVMLTYFGRRPRHIAEVRTGNSHRCRVQAGITASHRCTHKRQFCESLWRGGATSAAQQIDISSRISGESSPTGVGSGSGSSKRSGSSSVAVAASGAAGSMPFARRELPG